MENAERRRVKGNCPGVTSCEAVVLRASRLCVVLALVLATIGASSCSRSSNSTPTVPSTPQSPTPPLSAAIALTGNLAFGPIELVHTASAVMTIANSGTGTLNWSGVTTGNPDITANPSAGSVAPGGSTAVTITYKPTTPTSYFGVLTVQSNATSGTNAIAVSGRGGTAVLILTGTNIVFAGVPTIRFPPINIGMSEQAVLTLRNSGSGTLNITDMTLGGWMNDVKHYFISPTAMTIPSGQSRTTTITFAPQFDTGILVMDTELTVVSDKSGGDSVIGLHGCVRFSC